MGNKNKEKSPTDVPLVNYSEIPHDQRKLWILNDDLGIMKDYLGLLDWICEWGSKEGFDFGGIRSLRCKGGGYPLIEVSISTPGILEKKFLISRSSLYILAFHSAIYGWLVFDDIEFEIAFSEKFKRLTRPAKYLTEAWKEVGPGAMIDALERMESNVSKDAAEGCEVFMVHLCEASRLRLVQLMIAKTLTPIPQDVLADNNEELRIRAGSEDSVDILDDLAPLMIDLTKSVDCHRATEHCIKKFKQLSKTWYEYSLSGGELFELDVNIANSCGVRTVRTLNRMLCVLCNTNLDKIQMEWKKKLTNHNGPPGFTNSGFEKMCLRILEIETKEAGASVSSKECDEPPQKRICLEGTSKKKGKKKARR
ncbi:hypothetical protein DM860_016474 [Cuscuta australis]|uniref:Uncharacterized protein n=1 Tax=Cuscuta australis TaxID=267555 RepID=A0A328DHX3_9ASTE|nr:hypothetical protein DM860_016474 [Cuscuta australis]